jgi:hypothetical protein
MGIESALLGGLVGFTVRNAEDARKAASQNRAQQELAQRETRAVNSAASANERRQQIREERVRRARILQASSNAGTSGSSGEAGAIGGMQSQLASNVGTNLASLEAFRNISIFQQGAADADYRFRRTQMKSDLANSLFRMGMTAAGG